MTAWFGQLRRDVRFAVRALARRPGFAGLAVLTIALGSGATTAIFSVTDGVLFRPLPFPDADRLVAAWEVRPALGLPRSEAAPLNYVDWQRQATSFTALAAYYQQAMNLTGGGTPERVPVAGVTPNFMATLGAPPLIGRWFEPPDGQPGAARTAILSYGFWQRRFGGQPGVVGESIRLDDELYTVVGVMPRDFQLPHPRVRAWIPVDYAGGAGIQNRTLLALNVIGRLRPSVSVSVADAELKAIAGQMARQHPENRDASAVVVSLHDDLVRAERAALLLLLVAAGLVLLIACANVAGLLVTRGAGRSAEFALRTALGATRGQLLRQVLVEGLLLSGVGAACGLALATVASGVLDALVPAPLQGTVTVALNLRLFVFAVAAALITGMLFGFVPLRYAMHRDLRGTLGARGASIGAAGRSLQSLVVIEVALGVVVVFATSLILQTVGNLRSADVGFDRQRVLTARLELTTATYPTLERRLQFFHQLFERLDALPDVVSTGAATFLPFKETIGRSPLHVEGRPAVGDVPPQVYLRAVTPEYLATLRVPVLAGRGLTDRDSATGERVALVSQRLNAALGGTLLGQRVAYGVGSDDWKRVVGVVGDIPYDGVDAVDSRGALYFPAAQLAPEGFLTAFFMPRDLAIRTTGEPLTLATALRSAVWALDPAQPVADIRTLDGLVEGQIDDRKLQAGLLSSFAVLALSMAALGVYGLLSFTAAGRRREFAVRVALGANASDLVALLSRGSVGSVIAGTLVGSALTWPVSRAFRSVVFGVQPLDRTSVLAASGLLLLVAIGAALTPVMRAVRTDPAGVLKAE
jgi:predicted permease